MKESYDEGLASHIGPESCGYGGNIIFEALTGGNAGRVLCGGVARKGHSYRDSVR